MNATIAADAALHTERAESGRRIHSLDFVRGVAVMGILAMNAVAFAMPEQAYMDPAAFGADSRADLWSWALSFIFVEGKMRGLFSLLFGASMLLVIERADAANGNGKSVHVRRMLVLLGFGLAHYFLIWWGDILFSYAATGLIALLFVRKPARSLLKWAIGLFSAAFIVSLLLYASPLMLKMAASAPGADPQIVSQWRDVEKQMNPAPDATQKEVALHRSSYGAIVSEKVEDRWMFPLVGFLMFAPETLAFMLLGMWGYRSGFLTATWDRGRYARIAAITLAIAMPASAALAWLTYDAGFGMVVTMAAGLAGGLPFRALMALGYAALLMLIVLKGAQGWLGSRVAAAGRAAFTNYIGTSIVMTTIFYGYGLSLYGEVGRTELWLVVIAVWALMLAWSKPWLERFRYGPFEWLWRSLARGSVQPMRKAAASA